MQSNRMHSLLIERARYSDLPAILQLIEQPDMSPDIHLTPDGLAALFDSINANPWHELYTVRQENEIVGTFSLLFVQHIAHNGGRSLVVEDVVIKTELQGKGIGRYIMEFAITRGRDLGCYKLILSSDDKRTDAHSFYETLGFRKHGVSFYLPIGH
jgi:GNAT superfamily N-acetyltransferase